MSSNDDTVRKLIADRLKQYRIAKGLKGKEVAVRLGVSPKTVSAWECARAQPDADTLLMLCAMYDVESISVFYGTPDGINDQNEQTLLALFRQLNAEGQAIAINCVKGLELTGAYKKSDSDGMVQAAEELDAG